MGSPRDPQTGRQTEPLSGALARRCPPSGRLIRLLRDKFSASTESKLRRTGRSRRLCSTSVSSMRVAAVPCFRLVVALSAALPALPAAKADAATPKTGHGPTSIAQLGDSVAAGEGTLYGYTYDGSTRTWTGGTSTPNGPGPTRSAMTRLKHMDSCWPQPTTQSSPSSPARDRPLPMASPCHGSIRLLLQHHAAAAEFGDWSTKSDLNADYDAASPTSRW